MEQILQTTRNTYVRNKSLPPESRVDSPRAPRTVELQNLYVQMF